MEWFDNKGLMHLEPMKSPRPENAVLFTITYFLLYGKEKTYNPIEPWLKLFESDGVLYEEPAIPPVVASKRATSHDNMTAIITFMVIWGMDVSHLKIWHRYYHPRDFIYMGYLQRRWWAFPLLPVLFVIFLWSALTKYKVREVDGVKQKIFKTDTEILYWIRLHLPSSYWFIHATRWAIVPCLKLKYGRDWVRRMMEIYYQNPAHPNRSYK